MRQISRKGFNNILIFAILGFIVLFNLPTAVRDNITPPSSDAGSTDAVIPLIAETQAVSALHFPHFSLIKNNNTWSSNQSLPLPANELAMHWLMLTGTHVDNALLSKIKPHLDEQINIDVEYIHQNDVDKVMLFRLPAFWLLQNGQDQWLAVTVSDTDLLPLPTGKTQTQ